MTTSIGVRRGRGRGIAVMALASLATILTLLGALAPSPAAAAPRVSQADSRPTEGVAFARIAVARVLTTYYGTVGNSAPIPSLNPCVAEGALIATTDGAQNSFNYVLLPTSAISPILPCDGVQRSFAQLHGNATSWGVSRIEIVLNIAYTGNKPEQRGSLRYTIDPASISTNGGASGPRLVAYPLAPTANSPKHDLPILVMPQASDPPALGVGTAIELSNLNTKALGRDSVTPNEVPTSLYPVALPVDKLGLSASPSATAAGGSTPTTAPAGVTPKSFPVGVGAPVVNANGRLVGMVVSDYRGGMTVASLDDVKAAIGDVTTKPGQLMTQWRTGLDAFYANKPNYDAASSAFSAIASAYPDFGGVNEFLTAAQNKTTSVAEPAPDNVPQDETPGPTLAQAGSIAIYALAGIGALALLVVIGLAIFVMRRRRLAQIPPYDEQGLDLLPRNSQLPPADVLQPAGARSAAMSGGLGSRDPSRSPFDSPPDPMGRIPAVSVRPQGMPPSMSQGMPPNAPFASLEPPPPAPVSDGLPGALFGINTPARPRNPVILAATIAGLTDPGVRRALEPNQDNILALQGVRNDQGRPQPYALLIVADGMGGAMHGREASRLAIEIVSRALLPALRSEQALGPEMLEGLLRSGIAEANQDLRMRNTQIEGGMGTTMTAALLIDDHAIVANVGDSRTYVMSPEMGLRQITTDHSVVANLVAAGVIKREEMYSHPRRNQIFRSLGGDDETLEIDTFRLSFQAGDAFLLCSDGLWEMVHDPQIQQILSASADPTTAAQLLVREANANGGEDNIGVIVARLREVPPQEIQPGMRVVVAPQETQPH
ncbi:MAG TPA: protein phosphatase 2C domain-containing protein [Ktedonobacterales bacterium]